MRVLKKSMGWGCSPSLWETLLVMRQLGASVHYRRNVNGSYKIKQCMKNGTISELYTDDKKIKIS